MTATIPTLLQPLKDRLAAATPGPWHQGRESNRWENTREVYSEREVSATSTDVATAIHKPEDAALIANAPTDQAKLIAAIEAAEQSFIGRAESYRETSDRLNQQVIDRFPGRDPEAAARYSHYASAAESALQVFRIAITQALGGDTA